MAYKGFDNAAFMDYMESEFSGFSGTDGRYLRELVENLITYAHKWEQVGKDQFCYFLSDIMPEISFGEVAMFMEDGCLTADGQKEKRRAIEERKKESKVI